MHSRSGRFVLAVFAASCLGSPRAGAQGLALSGVGAGSRAFGGANVAAPLDASGALHWNPATITAFERSRLDFGVEMLHIPTELSSNFGANLSGKTEAESGIFPLPAAALVYRPRFDKLALGLGVFTIGGFGVNYPGSVTNPILMAPPPAGIGVGPIFSRLQVLQLAPTLAYRVTDQLSIGMAPTIDLAELAATPATIAPPDDANGDTNFTYPPGQSSRLHWGIGFQAGVYFESGAGWNLGASIKSPQWFEEFEIQSRDELGAPRRLGFDFEYPMIVSIGASYTGLERFTFAADGRWFDHENAEGLGAAVYDARGAVAGLGWDNIFAGAFGIQYQACEPLAFRIGYTASQNPIGDAVTSFNVASPAISQHTLYLGTPYAVSDAFTLTVMLLHSFANSIEGPLVAPQGPVPGTTVRQDYSANGAAVGVSVAF